MKQLFYVVAVIILMVIAHRLMKKIEDPPKEKEGEIIFEDLEVEEEATENLEE